MKGKGSEYSKVVKSEEERTSATENQYEGLSKKTASSPTTVQPRESSDESAKIDKAKTPSITRHSSQLLQEKLPFFGNVPISFYLPPDTPQEQIDTILINGGQVSTIAECFTFQISLIPRKQPAGDEDEHKSQASQEQ